jgi:ubiquinone/menaquinone biosynthesis C-methylase UbiE
VHASAGSGDIVLRTQRRAGKAFEILTADVGQARLSCASVFMWLQG